MSISSHRTKHTKEHGTVGSYIIGFLLSLEFTIIPYYLVVHKIVTGNALLATILGFAFLQMLIQIFFFLHLGRGPKPLYNVVFFVGTFGLILVVVLGSIFIMNNLYGNMSPSQILTRLAQEEGIAQIGGVDTGACQGVYTNHQVIIKDGLVTPLHTEAQLCDTITFINEDTIVRDIAFGPHPKHESYGGQLEATVHHGYPKTITLNQAGDFSFRDDNYPDTSGDFTVNE